MRPERDDFGADLPWDFAGVWKDIRMHYNPQFRRQRALLRRSYSVGLRPDISIEVSGPDGVGLHLLDPKFRVNRPAERTAGIAEEDREREDATQEPAEEGFAADGTFKVDDLFKMHAYRDAIPTARSVWILCPGRNTGLFRSGRLSFVVA